MILSAATRLADWIIAWISRCTAVPNKVHGERLHTESGAASALTATPALCIQLYDLTWPPTTTCIHAWPSCTAPFTAFPLLFLLMIPTINNPAYYLFFLSCILFSFNASAEVKWGRKWAKAYHCLPYWDVYGPPHAAPPQAHAHLHETEYVCLYATPPRTYQELFLCLAEPRLRLWNVKWVLKNRRGGVACNL